MEIQIPKVIRALRLAEYAPEYGEAQLQVWVNPPRGMLTGYDALIDRIQEALQGADAAQIEALSQERIEFYAQIWSQGPESTRMSREEIEQLIEQSLEHDPRLWDWLCSQTLRMIAEYRAIRKKAWKPPS